MSTLLLEAPLQIQAPWPYVLTHDGHSATGSGQGLTDQWPAADQTVLAVPARALSWHKVDLPKLPAARFEAALQAILEEQVLGDAADLHIALMPGLKPGAAANGAWVAVCSKSWLTQTLAVVTASGRTVSRIVPSASPVSAGQAERSSVTAEEGGAWLCTSTAAGVWTCPLAAQAALGVPVANSVQAEPAVAAQADQLFGQGSARAVQDQAQVQVSAKSALLLTTLAQDWNLAQGALASSAQSRRWQSLRQGLQELASSHAWRWPRRALIATVLVNLLGLNLWAWHEHSQLQSKRDRMAQLLTQTFPATTLVVDAPVQMQKQLQILEQHQGLGSASDFESLLAQIGQVSQAHQVPSQIEYKGQQLTAKDLSLSASALEGLRRASPNLNPRQQGADLVMGVSP